MNINYSRLADAINFYKTIGYSYLEVPWAVRPEANAVTAPSWAWRFSTDEGELVGSGEQSFVEMWMGGNLPAGKYVCCTPCFRHEKLRDELHLGHFMKVELIEVDPPDPLFAAKSLRDDAWLCIECAVRTARLANKKDWHPNMVQIVVTSEGEDIEVGGVEVGSYGHRSVSHMYKRMVWAYGTGIAEPRLSQAIELLERKQ